MLHIRLCRDDTVVELEGDADAVQAQLASLQSEGYGRLLEFFGPATPGRRPVAPEPEVHPAIALAPIAEPALSLRFVLDRIVLPRSPADFAADLDGNGSSENAFGGLIEALASSNLDAQASVDASVASFASPLLLTFTTEEFDLTVDQRADVRIEAGRVVDAAGSEAATVLSPLLHAALAPDVALDSGEPQALSVGIGFRASHATF
jgi:hypothetical protein